MSSIGPGSDGGDRASALERSVVGALLAVLALGGFAWAIQIPSGNLVGGGIGLLVLLGAVALLVRLFLEGIDEPER